jgi:hypothetical protein
MVKCTPYKTVGLSRKTLNKLIASHLRRVEGGKRAWAKMNPVDKRNAVNRLSQFRQQGVQERKKATYQSQEYKVAQAITKPKKGDMAWTLKGESASKYARRPKGRYSSGAPKQYKRNEDGSYTVIATGQVLSPKEYMARLRSMRGKGVAKVPKNVAAAAKARAAAARRNDRLGRQAMMADELRVAEARAAEVPIPEDMDMDDFDEEEVVAQGVAKRARRQG